jgi:hypothetical protein
MEDKEKRKDIRVSFRTEISIAYNGEKLHLGGDSVNLSMGGLFAASSEEVPLGMQCQIHLRLSGTEEPIELTMKGKVVRHEQSGFGIHFEEMDLDSYSILKEIVRHNAQEPDLV